MDLEAGLQPKRDGGTSWRVLLTLAYQSFGVVYGDVSISPLYVFKSSFAGIVKLSEDDVEILGITSLIFWTFTLVLVIKYACFVLRADDNGEGGTFALYSLLCRHAKLSHLPNLQGVDEELTTYRLESFSKAKQGQSLKPFLEKHSYLHSVLLIVVLVGTCMVIGDGVLTPTISVLSAVSGIRVAAENLNERVVVCLACVVLMCLFALQRFGTHRVAFMFAPIVITWLFCILAIGIYNICHWNHEIVKALSPYHIYKFFKVTGKDGWMSLGGVVLSITGAEAMFADLGHFSQISIQLAFLCGVYPCLMVAYMGEAAFLSKNREALGWTFYKSIPKPIFWPVFVVATLASIVGSQAIISATFSIIKQCSSLGCFPRVKIVHTSKNIYGQVYVPEINWILLILCLAITIGFQDTTLIGNAYGLAVVTVMLVTTCLMSLVIVVVWERNILLALAFLLFFGSIELVYISSCLIKVHEGGWVPLVLAIIFMAVMYTWNYGLRKKYEFELQNKVSMKWLLTLGPSLGIVRVPGIGLVYTELVSGVPAIFSHFVTNLPAFHQIVVFVSIKAVPVPYVLPTERFLVGRIGPKEYHMFRCIVRFGYKDVHKDDDDFESQLVCNLGEFIQSESDEVTGSANEMIVDGQMKLVRATSNSITKLVESQRKSDDNEPSSLSLSCDESLSSSQSLGQLSSTFGKKKDVRFELSKNSYIGQGVRDELRELVEAKAAGVAYILGHSYVKASSSSSFLKKFAINVAYSFLKKNCRGPSVALNIPHTCLIEVGMIYHV
ncbi:hypothetical protein GOP47_0016069 [Adiantum capillus-veneris]|uniref:Potassium transporter n=1 Tax=Adiantum capillus-veneris TaxID=13818 RepID=A0A9D4UM02_ADICA|nr:hypothetical protein GOP47_0016069 [Adiantum capillus-veneris]